MTIAVHIDLTGPTDDPIKHFNYHCFTALAGKYPNDHFIFISDKPFETTAIKQKNITPVVLTPQIRSNLLLHFWYNFKLPGLLNKYNADVFVSNNAICSSRTDIPQCMIVHDLAFMQKKGPAVRTEDRYLRKYFARFAGKAKKIIFSNGFIKDEVIKKIPAAAGKSEVVAFGIPDIFRPCDLAVKENSKEQFAAGKEYFLFYVTASSWPNIVIMLKAFSVFKKWQRSDMQLVLLFSASEKERQIKDLGSYKYRDEIKIIQEESIAKTALITGAAYAAIHLPAAAVAESEGIYSLKSGIPLISTDNGFCKAIYLDAALYADNHEKNIAEKMILLYKDEHLRNALIARGNIVAAEYNREKTADLLWQVLLDSAEG